MPELPEVETVRRTLSKQILNKKIVKVNVYYENTVVYPTILEFKKQLINQTIIDLKRKGKWLIFELNDYYLLSHLRMEGKYFLKQPNSEVLKHEHVSFIFDDGMELRYHDVRKFGKMYLYSKEIAYNCKPLNELGLEPWDNDLTIDYLIQKYQLKKIPIKTSLLDQSIITGIGNIYADEILFLSSLNPLKPCCYLRPEELQKIIDNTKIILDKAITLGGTTIRSYTSSEGVHGRFQNELLVHTKKNCPNCQIPIVKIIVNGRGTYYCPNCQK